MRVFVIGSEGQIARALKKAAAQDNGIALQCASRPSVDLSHPSSITTAVAEFRPDIVINPASYTAVDRAESEADLAFAINRDGAGAVAAAAAEHGAPIIHFSTDYVFDGKKSGPYFEDDPVNPQSVYGRSKLEGEFAVAAMNPQCIVLRTSWVYAPFGGNFVRTMIRLSAERDELRVVSDQLGCPTYAPDIAAATLAIARSVVDGGWRPSFAGVTHLAGPDAISWYDFARAILEAGAKRGAREIPVRPIKTSDYPTAAVRPANSSLSTARLRSVFDLVLPPLEQSLAQCLAELLPI